MLTFHTYSSFGLKSPLHSPWIRRSHVISAQGRTSPVHLLSGKECFVGMLPMFHVFGMSVYALKSTFVGATSVLLPRFEPQVFLNAIKKYQVRIADCQTG